MCGLDKGIIDGSSYLIQLLLIHSADPQPRPVVIIVSKHVFRSYVRPSVPKFQNKTNFKRKQRSLLVRLCVWQSGSLMTPVLFIVSGEMSRSKGKRTVFHSLLKNATNGHQILIQKLDECVTRTAEDENDPESAIQVRNLIKFKKIKLCANKWSTRPDPQSRQ